MCELDGVIRELKKISKNLPAAMEGILKEGKAEEFNNIVDELFSLKWKCLSVWVGNYNALEDWNFILNKSNEISRFIKNNPDGCPEFVEDSLTKVNDRIEKIMGTNKIEAFE